MGLVDEFWVKCATCQARLKVRDPAAEGKILPCPRCGSMVLVSREGDRPPASDDPNAPSDPSDPSDPPRPAETGETSVSDLGIASPLPSFDFEPPDSSDASPAEPGKGAAIPAAPSVVEAIDRANLPSGAEQPIVPGQHWTSQESRELKRWLLIGVCGVAAVLVLIGLAGFWMAQQRRRVESLAEAASAPLEAPGASGSPSQPAPNLPNPPADPDAADNGPDSPEGAPRGEQSANEQPSGVANADPTVPETLQPESTPPAPTQSVPGQDVAGPPPTADSGSSAGSSVFEGDPVLPGFPGSSPPRNADPPGLTPPAVGQPNPTGLSSALQDLEQMVQAAPQNELMSEDPRDYEFVLYTPDHLLFAGQAPIRPPAPRRLDMQRQFRLPVTQLQTPALPLTDLAQWVTRLSNVPVAIDLDALHVLGLEPTVVAPAGQASGNLGQVATRILQPLGLTLAPDEQYVSITSPKAKQPQVKIIDLKEVLQNTDEGPQLEQWIRELVLSPQELAEGVMQIREARLRVQLLPAAIARVERFVEQLTIARHLPSDPTAFDPKLQLSYVQARGALQQRLTVNRTLKTSMQALLNELARKSHTTIVIDWAALAPIGWSPDEQLTLVCQNEELTLALALVLIPMELDYYVAGPNLLIVTTAPAVEQYREVNLHRVADLVAQGADPPTLLRALRFRLGEEHFQTAQSPWRIEYDAVSRCFLASLPQRAQVQMAAMLATLRSRLRG